ncbi:hypothetical protein EVG20_g7331 [Dentipellis fragilis]|uniref:DUF300-domain-containing protein n=1 Tax=Dentipellis fragilis TaxID=205917 RepID=A0A4Y9YGJ0_9AGAM|nr:hypothetical protein EVG20_g7331 [Dentipellis fragilis]
MAVCPEENTQSIDQSKFWSSDGPDWDQHRIGWAIAGTAAVITVIITIITVLKHCRNYTKPNEQRQIIRILYMPAVYAVISFFSFRFFRSYTYYSLIEVVYEAFTISAFLLLIIEYVADTGVGHSAQAAIARKDKQKLPIPFCCWRYRPTKAYFMYTIKWSVMQYVIIRPAVSIAGIICEKYKVLCESGSYNVHFAAVYLDFVDFFSIRSVLPYSTPVPRVDTSMEPRSIALYGLLLFYGLMKDELKGRRPLAKFLSIKLIVFFTFYQSFVFNFLKGNVIHGTQYWTSTNVADGLNALATCLEMILFSGMMMWAYTWNEYKIEGAAKTSIWRPLWDSINFSDFLLEIWGSLRFFVDLRAPQAERTRAAAEHARKGGLWPGVWGGGVQHGADEGCRCGQ